MNPANERAERDSILESVNIVYDRAIGARSVRPMLLLGHGCSGITDLLNEITGAASQKGLFVSRITSSNAAGLARILYSEMLGLLRSLSTNDEAGMIAIRGLRGLAGFALGHEINCDGIGELIDPEPGLADSGDMYNDLPALFAIIGDAARVAGNAWAIIMDDLQCLVDDDLAALISAIHRASQDRLPMVFIGGGEPQLARLVGEAAGYAERLFVFVTVGERRADN